MAIHAIDDYGNIHWKCQGLDNTCGKDNYAHVAHEGVAWINDRMVRLPACPTCGAVYMFNVTFSEREKEADNTKQYGMVPTPMTLPHALTGEQIPVLIPALKPIGVNPYFERHEQVAELLKKHGKHPPDNR